jgi:hypothetical protein
MRHASAAKQSFSAHGINGLPSSQWLLAITGKEPATRPVAPVNIAEIRAAQNRHRAIRVRYVEIAAAVLSWWPSMPDLVQG